MFVLAAAEGAPEDQLLTPAAYRKLTE